MQAKDFENVPIEWEPTETSGEKVKDFWKYINKKYKAQIDNFWDLHKWSVENVAAFWEEIWNTTGIIRSRNHKLVLEYDSNMPHIPKWFQGARMNIAENILKYRDDNVALHVIGEDKESKCITYAEIYKEACRYGASLKKLGLKKNDSVACYMSNREEAIFAMLGATSSGAIYSGALPLLGANAVLNRFSQVKPKFLFAVDEFLQDGEMKYLLENLEEISEGLPSLKKIIIVPSKEASRKKDISRIKNSCFLDEFLSVGESEDGNAPDLEFEQLPFDHPIYISYTSGTTGTPKPLVHGFGSLLCSSRDFALHSEVNRETVHFSISPVGWVTWNMYANMLSLGLQIVLYEGIPFYKSPTHLWDLVDKFNITTLFLTPSVLDELEKRGYVPGKKNHLSSLKTLFSGASVVKPQNYDFVYKKVKTDVIFGSAYGSTEIMGASMLLDQTLPVYRGEISTAALGVKVCCLNNKGESVVGELGELVFATLAPSMPLGIWGDADHKRFKETYFDKFPGFFATGDLAYINPITKGIIVCCRSDDTLKPKGVRFGSSEIYNIVDMFPEVMDSLCVSQYNKDSDERAVLFLEMRTDHLLTEDLIYRISRAIERELSIGHVPEVILEIPDIPHNMNGKKMEIIVKKIINKMPYNPETVINPESLDHFMDVPELQGY